VSEILRNLSKLYMTAHYYITTNERGRGQHSDPRSTILQHDHALVAGQPDQLEPLCLFLISESWTDVRLEDGSEICAHLRSSRYYIHRKCEFLHS